MDKNSLVGIIRNYTLSFTCHLLEALFDLLNLLPAIYKDITV
jgi:hypothetical protein